MPKSKTILSLPYSHEGVCRPNGDPVPYFRTLEGRAKRLFPRRVPGHHYPGTSPCLSDEIDREDRGD